MTTDERVKELMKQLPYLNKTEGGVAGFKEKLRLALLEAMRDQRHACVRAIIEIEMPPGTLAAAHVMKIKCEQAAAKAEVK